MTTTERGRAAELLAATHLERRGFEVLDRNWRNRWCELDIVARSPAGVHLVEVKYRRRTNWGTGFEAVTAHKMQRLERAALAWCQAHRYYGAYQIDVVSVTGELDRPNVDYLANVTFG